MSEPNPFAETAANPFADPAATGSYVPPAADGDPFGGGSKAEESAPLFATSAPSAPATSGASDSYAFKSQSEREAELAERERRLQQREAELSRREGGTGGADTAQKPNWPPCFPVTYNNITADIPPHQRMLVRLLYYHCIFAMIGLWWNFFVNIVLWISSKPASVVDYRNAADFLWSALYAALGTWGAWNGWYKSLYNGIKKDASSRFLCFFIVFLMHCGFSIVAAVGVPSTSLVGILTMITISSGWSTPQHPYTFLIIITIVASCLWVINATCAILLLFKTHREYQNRGREGLNDVRRAGAGAVAQEATSAMFAGQGKGGAV